MTHFCLWAGRSGILGPVGGRVVMAVVGGVSSDLAVWSA